MLKKLQLEDRYLGAGEPVFVIAEAGVNHNGNIDIADSSKDGKYFFSTVYNLEQGKDMGAISFGSASLTFAAGGLNLTVSVLASHSDWLVEAAGTPGQTGDEGHGEAPSHGGDRVRHVALRPDGRPLADGNRGVGQGFRSALG